MGHQEDMVGIYRGVVINVGIIGIKVETVTTGGGRRLENKPRKRCPHRTTVGP